MTGLGNRQATHLGVSEHAVTLVESHHSHWHGSELPAINRCPPAAIEQLPQLVGIDGGLMGLDELGLLGHRADDSQDDLLLLVLHPTHMLQETPSRGGPPLFAICANLIEPAELPQVSSELATEPEHAHESAAVAQIGVAVDCVHAPIR